MPREGHDPEVRVSVSRTLNFNPRAPRGARRSEYGVLPDGMIISIHVPREGHDQPPELGVIGADAISIHVPREGHDDVILGRTLKIV